MSEDRIKIKDLGVDLSLDPKDVLRAAQSMGMTAKTPQGSVSLAEATRLREHFAAQKRAEEDRNGRPRVIVRRRRRDAQETQASAETVAESKTPSSRTPGGKPQESRASGDTPQVGRPDQESATRTPAVGDVASGNKTNQRSAAPRQRPTRPAINATARVIQRPSAPLAPTDSATKPEPQSSQAASPGDVPAALQAQSTHAEAAMPTTARPDPRSEPTTLQDPGQAAQGAQEGATQEVGALAAQQERAEPAPEHASPQATPDQGLETSAPSPAAMSGETQADRSGQVQEALADAALPEASTPSVVTGQSREGRQEGDSAEGKEAQNAKDAREPREGRDQRSGKNRAEGKRGKVATPQVRIISRPSPEAVTAARPTRRSDARPAPTKEAAPRPGRSSGPGRSFVNRNSGYAQQPGPASLDGREGQSKKKRNKGRRTVDFQSGDFGRHGLDEDDTTRMNRSRGRRKPSKPAVPAAPQVTQPIKAAKRKIRVTEAIRLSDLAHQMGLKATEIIKLLFNMGVMATINQSLDIDTATLVAAEFNYEVEKAGFSEDDYLLPKEADAPESLKPRPPVVTIMGHVDHGKTSLLDAIRKSNVTSGEAGGITQHIGAYHVRTKRGEIVFLDTPGHEAFTAMRARGAQVTDLVILVVAADDGVMEQTREAINHSKAAGVPIMVAVNKMDKPGADPDRVLRELSELGLQPEDWGGDTIVARVSAKTRQGLDDLLEMVALQSEIMELKANPDKPARGHIIEARLDKGRGPVATVLIQEGTLHQGDNFVCGAFSGRVRALINDQGKKVKDAGPSLPVEVQGFEGVPEAGEEFFAVADEKVARRIADGRAAKLREHELASESRVTLETWSQKLHEQETLVLNLLVKADVQGSLEAITEAVNKLSTDKVRINVVHGGTGAISESDILLATASQAIIIGFNVRPTAKIKDVAERENVDIRFYDIIYKLVDDIRSAMTGMLAPVQREVYLGQVEVRETFNVPKVGVIAGAYVADGKITRNAGARLLREGVVVYSGKVASLRRFKDDVKEVVKGNECGVGLENFNDIKIGDIIDAFETVQEAATL
ncbi:MAG: translation initiation factor IF-2 [Desulfovibrio sp.]|nr:translation initiation factor IF-2 [Desulfovibrio sp.]